MTDTSSEPRHNEPRPAKDAGLPAVPAPSASASARPTPAIVVFHSLRHLRFSMICWRVHRTLKGVAIRMLEQAGMSRTFFDRETDRVAVSLVPPVSGRYHCEDIDPGARRFSFLHDVEILPADPAALRAAVERKPLLWQFHFGYHDYLIALLQNAERAGEDTARTAEAVLAFIEEWSAAFPLHAPGARRSAWHAYVLSIRIESWVRLHAMLREAGIPEHDPRLARLAGGVERMTRVLLRNLEKGTMANHLLRNIKALVFAGLYLDTAAGAQARRIGTRLLERELAEQILDDGCHFERSPMYHVSMTNDILDMAEAIILCGSTVSDRLGDAAVRMTAFLETVRHPDGEIPFFNDSTGSFFLRTDEVLARGQRLAGEIREGVHPDADAPEAEASDGEAQSGEVPSAKAASAETPDAAGAPMNPRRVSGLLVAQNPRAWLVMDAGQVGPDYQPGHAHCDTLSFELSLDGRRFITDTGVYHYRESRERSYSRSTAAHNTIEIDGAEQSEVWKSFRVGRRARIRHLSRTSHEGIQVLRGMHDGYTRLQSGMLHERAMLLAEDWILIADWLHGSGAHRLRSFLHFHPGVSLRAKDAAAFDATRDGTAVRLRLHGGADARITDTEYYPAFGEKQSRQSIVSEFGGAFPLLLVTELVFGTTAPQVTTEGNRVRISGFGDLGPHMAL